ncbi:flagellar biosynthesis protein FlgL [Tardiphaga sp.]|uniref:flagellar biosynthesis protein FlgL n=1 Tax=Tardiphaga sp. TaxID=1926292 RepID=UPI0025E5739D|nr:flagellar biosynthesis protein FlgL [Tardiphaga sp.]
MTIDGVSGRTSYIGSGILDLRSQLDTLTQQLASGKVSTTYAGQGSGRSLAIGLRSQLAKLDSYADTAVNVNTRIQVANLSLQRLADIGSSVKGAAVSAGSTLDNTGQTAGQKTASLGFFDSVDMLNAQSGDRYLFSGRATDTAPVAPADQIMNGNGATIAGLKTVISERKQADLGTGGLGRVTTSMGATATSVKITEDDPTGPLTAPPLPPAAQPFGLKLTGVSTAIVGASVTQPVDLPATVPPAVPAAAVSKSMSVDLGTTNPQIGDQVKFTFQLPDGTSEDVVMTATATAKTPMDANTFLIGATTAATAASLNTELGKSMSALANGPLVAASAMAAGKDFFGEPPMRVSGTPLGASTTLVAGTKANTVIWYQGETGTDSARGTAVAQVDQGITVQYGARADEQALRSQLQNVAVFAAVTTSATDPNANAQIAALNQRVAQNLATVPGTQTIQDIQADFAGAQASVKATTDRQVQTKVISQTMLDSIEGINNDEVATKILALQTALQASYQTTSKLYQMSLVKFL